MTLLSQLTTEQLKRAIALREQIDALQSELAAIGAPQIPIANGQDIADRRGHWSRTPEGRAIISRKVRKYWRNRKRLAGA